MHDGMAIGFYLVAQNSSKSSVKVYRSSTPRSFTCSMSFSSHSFMTVLDLKHGTSSQDNLLGSDAAINAVYWLAYAVKWVESRIYW